MFCKTELLAGVTVRGKPVKDLHDIEAHDRAVKLLFNIGKRDTELTTDLVKICLTQFSNCSSNILDISNYT